jgi:hypothetical protein
MSAPKFIGTFWCSWWRDVGPVNAPIGIVTPSHTVHHKVSASWIHWKDRFGMAKIYFWLQEDKRHVLGRDNWCPGIFGGPEFCMWCLHISNALIREQQMHSSSKFSLNSMKDILGAILWLPRNFYCLRQSGKLGLYSSSDPVQPCGPHGADRA